ncbi:MAG: hypothetical protein HFG54_14925 [Lachnospiraceae bacterium]|nr:hypothetical protein [Lachnospiraceae bacterium]
MDYKDQIKSEIELALEVLYSNNQSKLRQMCNKAMLKFGGILQEDYDDFYSRAGYELNLAREKYDPSTGSSPMEYFYGVIKKAVWKEMSYRNRAKRRAVIEKEEEDEYGNRIKKKEYIHNLSLDSLLDQENCLITGDLLQYDLNIEDIFSEDEEEAYSERVKEFLDSLSPMQKTIAIHIMKGYKAEKIKAILNITDKQYRDCWSEITSYDKKRILYKENKNMEEENRNNVDTKENVNEKYKNTSYSIDSISKQLRKKRIRDDHILQRHSGQWKCFAKSELVSDILRGKSLTQIIISEEIKNGIKMQWLIDGKQRCTTLDDYLYDGFAVSHNVKNYSIMYQTPKVGENGNEILNEEGFPDMEWTSVDIRGKKFSQLPDELQDIFRDRQIPVLYNMDCTKKDIADDIARFNRSRPMNKAQNGWLGLEESFAEFVENIAKMQFFQPEFIGTTYTKNNNTSGAIRRIIVEGIMVSDFVDDFGDFDKMCKFLSEEASDSNFTEFYSLVERLTLICNTKETALLFDAKDSFLWFGLFSRFVRLGMDDKLFANFMNGFHLLRKTKISEKSFDNILEASKSTKDKSIVRKKMKHMEQLLYNYLKSHGALTGKSVSDKNGYTEKEIFIADVVNMGIDKVREEMEVYNETLDDLEYKTIKDGSKLLEDENRISLLAMVAYSYNTDTDLDEWLLEYAKKNRTYLTDQRKNFLRMRKDFDQYCMVYRESG